MFILEKLVKSHFEMTGSPEGFPFMDLLTKESEEFGKSVEETFYSLLGYKSVGRFSAKDVYTIRKELAGGNTSALVPSLLKDEKELSIVKKDEKIVGKERLPVMSKVNASEDLKQAARLLSVYFMESEELEIVVGDLPMLFGSYLTKVCYSMEPNKLAAFIDNATFKTALQIVTPRFEHRNGCTPTINNRTMFLPFKLDKKNSVDKLVKLAVLQAWVKVLDIPEKVFAFISRNAATYQLSDASKYLNLLDYSYVCGKTVKQLFETCGLQYVDNLHYFNLTRCVIYLNGQDSYRVYSANSRDVSEYIVLSGNEVKELYTNGGLKTLNWSDGTFGPYIVHGGKRVYLNANT